MKCEQCGGLNVEVRRAYLGNGRYWRTTHCEDCGHTDDGEE